MNRSLFRQTGVTHKLSSIFLLMKLTEKQIKEIADNLDSGMKCYYNQKTGETKTIIDFDSWNTRIKYN